MKSKPTVLEILAHHITTEKIEVNELAPYHQNFIKGVKLIMADAGLDNIKETAALIGIPYMAMWKIVDGTNKPSIENCIKLLKVGKFSAQWLLMNEGDIYFEKTLSLHAIAKELATIKKTLTK